MGQLSIVLIIPPVAGLVTYFVVRFFSKRDELEIASRRKKPATIRESSASQRARKQNEFLRLTSLVFVGAKETWRGFNRAVSATTARSAPPAETSDARTPAGLPFLERGTVKRWRDFFRASSATKARRAPVASNASRTKSPTPQRGTVKRLHDFDRTSIATNARSEPSPQWGTVKKWSDFDRASVATNARSEAFAETSGASTTTGSPSPQWSPLKRWSDSDGAFSANARSAPVTETSSASTTTGSPSPQWGPATLLAVGTIGAIGGFALVWYLLPLALTMKHLLLDAARAALDFF
jgi:hypothetical protein